MDKKGRFDIGWKLLKSFDCRPGFFIIGIIIAFFKAVETEPEVREKWIISVIKEEREGRQSLTKWGVRGSSFQVEDLELWFRETISLVEGILK